MPTQDNIVLMKHERPKRIELPDGRTFLARYKWVARDHLPANIRMGRWYWQRVQSWNRHCCCRPCQGGQREQVLNIGRIIMSLLGF